MTSEQCANQFECVSDRILSNPYAVVTLRILVFGISTALVALVGLLIYRSLS